MEKVFKSSRIVGSIKVIGQEERCQGMVSLPGQQDSTMKVNTYMIKNMEKGN
jgi:hypothetical protein